MPITGMVMIVSSAPEELSVTEGTFAIELIGGGVGVVIDGDFLKQMCCVIS